jgi:hypothetical protein
MVAGELTELIEPGAHFRITRLAAVPFDCMNATCEPVLSFEIIGEVVTDSPLLAVS